MKSASRTFFGLIVSIVALCACGIEAKKLGADCTEVGTIGAAHGLEPCFKLAAKYPDAKHGGLEIAWSGIQMHCSYMPMLSWERQTTCDNACVQMRTFSAGHSAPSGVGGTTYKRTGPSAGECIGGEGASSGGGSRPGKPTSRTPLGE